MRRNFHLIPSLGDEILSSRARVQDADSAISLICATSAAQPLSTRSIACRKNSSDCGDPQDRVGEFAGFARPLWKWDLYT
jgi:hypothetical protein